MSVCGGLGGGELSILEELLLVSGDVHVGLGGVPLVLDSRRELVAKDSVGVVSFEGGGVGVGGEIQEQHPVPMKFLDGGHIVANLGEEDGCRLVVAVPERGAVVI